MTKKIFKTRAELEALALAAVKRAKGCRHVKSVRLAADGDRPNWKLVATTPALPPIVLIEAGEAVESLIDRYMMVDE